MSERRQDLEDVAEEIERYLNFHPNAADTLEGIIKWWLPQQRYHETLKQVQRALNLLVFRGRVEKTSNFDGTSIYKKAEK